MIALIAFLVQFHAVELSEASAQPAKQSKEESTFKTEGVSFLRKHCLSCHSGAKPRGDLSLDKFPDGASLLKDRKTWARVLDVLKSGEMPPESKPKPVPQELEAFSNLVNDIFAEHDRTMPPDPGRVEGW
jgi:cytochrome c